MPFRLLDITRRDLDLAHVRDLALAAGLVGAPTLAATPAQVDLSIPGEPMRDQGDRELCWAYAGASALQVEYFHAYGQNVRVSAEYVGSVVRASNLSTAGEPDYPTTLEGAQGNSAVVATLTEVAAPPSTLAPDLPRQADVLTVLTELGLPGVAELTPDQRDDYEFAEQRLPLLARVNARYRGTAWATVGGDPTVAEVEQVLASGHPVCADFDFTRHPERPEGQQGKGGHTTLIVGYDRAAQVWLVQNSWGGTDLTRIPYAGDAHWSPVRWGCWFTGIADPTWVHREACWLGRWHTEIDGAPATLMLRRTSEIWKVGKPTRLGVILTAHGRHQVNGRVYDNGRAISCHIAPAGVSTAPGATDGRSCELRLDDTDPYLAWLVEGGRSVALRRHRDAFAAIWAADRGYAWRSDHALDPAGQSAHVSAMAAEGFRLVAVDGRAWGDGSRLSTVWTKEPGPPWLTRHGQTSADLQADVDTLPASGWRLTHLSGYAERGTARFATVWEQRPGPTWRARHGLSGAEFQAAFDQESAQGMAVRRLQCYRVGLETHFVALWEHAPGDHVSVRHGLTPTEFADEFRRRHAAGETLSWLNGYPDVGAVREGSVRYAAVWTRPAALVRHGLDEETYRSVFAEQAAAGLRPVCLSVYGAAG